ncbi:MAG: hypothetical protein IT343_19815 [Candidatus Melainabacteria bacterium]|nr:hypothetical protein [Candidatus Melainabacteria bacterium]
MTSFNSSKRRLVAGALVLSQAFLIAPLSVLAASADVHVAGVPVISSKVAVGGMSPEARAGVIQKNLDNALVASKDRSPSSVNITYVKGSPVITLGGYKIVEVDAANAKASGTTPALLAKRWADALRNTLVDQASVESYVAQLTGEYSSSAPAVAQAPQRQQSYSATAQPPTDYYQTGAPQGYGAPQQATYGMPPQGGYGAPPQGYGAPQGFRQGRVAYAPAGLTIAINLQTAISTQVAKPGDLIQATINQSVMLGDSQIPAGSLVIGTVTDASAGRYFGRASSLTIKFNRLRTPDGIETPITAHLVGGIGKYTDGGSDQDDTLRGETWKTKVGQGAIRGAIGAGTGAALGTAVGAIAGGRGGVGRGAWSGTAIGAGAGVAQSLIMRKGKEVTIPSGTAMQLQLDAPVTIAGGGHPMSGNF